MQSGTIQFGPSPAASAAKALWGQAPLPGVSDNGVQGADGSFNEAFARAKNNLTGLAQKLVASAFLLPMISQMRDDPFKTDLFHGGFAEDAFMQQYDTRTADNMASSTDMPVVKTLAEHFTRWLKDNPGRVEHAAQIRMDTLG
jgi:hypothetical protein